ncbi:TadE/TadG family type IV pilus assembly protein [Azospirillum sp. sgz301742]
MIEFAFALPLLLAILIAIIETATFFWTRNTLQFAAEEGARTALVSTSATTTAVKAAVVAKLNGAAVMDSSKVTVTAVQDTYAGVTFMKVTATYAWPATGITGLLPVDLGSISGQARVPMVQ